MELRHMVRTLDCILEEGGSKTDFMEVVGQTEKKCAQLRATVIRHSRAWGRGVRADGQPDRRFKQNRTSDPTRPDLRRS